MLKVLVLLVFGVGALASAFSCLASIIHFQILWALGYFFLALVLAFPAMIAYDNLSE